MKVIGKMGKWLAIGLYAACAVVIIAFLVPSSGWKALNVLTGSMEPVVHPGDLVFIHHAYMRDLHTGNIVTYKSTVNPALTITHRVVSIRPQDSTLVTKGDANSSPDKPISAAQVVGKVAVIVPGAGRFTRWLQSPFALAALVVIPGIIVIWAEFQKLFRTLATPSAAPSVPAPEPKVETPPVPHRRPSRRGFDGIRSLAILAIIGGLMVGTSSTLALAVHTNAVKLRGNTIKAGSITKDDCKNSGWKTFHNPNGSLVFKNQGLCVAHVVSKGAKSN